ncbi:MAG: penicillin acylase family protein, partial [Rhodospirillales bacterium]|nr:penicillin acylase family protein [Rhodospirillales bacterium]
NLPNLWLLAGVKSPSYNAVGLMIPGLPFVALGRNQAMGWGGTNLRAASSDLYDVSRELGGSIEVREVEIVTRFWFNDTRQLRRSRLGPIVSDAAMIEGRDGEVLALRWVGHEPTDEITAFLAANRASTAEAFREAYRDYGVSAQNMLFAARNGDIGQIMAIQAPARQPGAPTDLVLRAGDPASQWGTFDNSTTLPFVYNPDTGFLASANNKPRQSDRLLGYFFSPDDRVARMAELVQATPKLSVEDLKRIQQDVTSPPSLAIAQVLAEEAAEAGAQPAAFVQRVANWDGGYMVASTGAPAFELLLTAVAQGLYGDDDGKVPSEKGQWSYLTTFLLRDLAALPETERRDLLQQAVAKAAADVDAFPTWGDLHKLRIGHMLSMAPLMGSRFILERVPVGGSRETLWKTAHGLIEGEHDARYGAQSRHISDLGDPNANYFVLLGGQDGWLGSENYADQVPLWLNGGYLTLPLEAERARTDFPHHMRLGS